MLPVDFLIFLQIILFLFISPGPPRVVIVSHSLNYGLKRSVWTAFGDISANICQGVLVVLTSEKVKADSKVFQWFNYVAYATLAALLARMIIFPAGVLAEADLILRLIVLISCIMLFIITKKNLVLPTVFSAILLSLLSSL
jgi:branched-subunit amino acid transport protein